MPSPTQQLASAQDIDARLTEIERTCCSTLTPPRDIPTTATLQTALATPSCPAATETVDPPFKFTGSEIQVALNRLTARWF